MQVEMKFPYAMRGFARSLGLRWDKKRKIWKGNLNVHAAHRLQDQDVPDVHKIIEFLEFFKKREEVTSNLRDITPSTHQIECASRCKAIKRFGVFHDMGTGKTVTMILVAQDLYLEKKISKLLVIAPLGVLSEWEAQINDFMTVPFTLFRLTGTSKKRIELTEQFLEDRPELSVAIVNYDIFGKWKKGMPETLKTLLENPPDMIVADESTRIKNKEANASKGLILLSNEAEYAFALTGTPMPNNVGELFNQIRFLSAQYIGRSYWAFLDRYAKMGGWENRQILGIQNENELQEILSYFTHTVRKEDVLDLPPKTFSVHETPMKGSQKKAYSNSVKEFVFAVDAVKSSDPGEKQYNVLIKNALVRLTYCQRIAAGHIKDEESGETVRFKDNPKVNTVLDIVQDYGRKPVIIFCRFTEDILILHKALQKIRTPVMYHGKMPSKKADENKLAFQSGEADVFISQVQKGGYGLNLAMASLSIFFTNWFSYGTRRQAEDRTHRRGQKRSCHYIDVVASDSVDELILNTIRNKESIVHRLFGRELENSGKP